MLAALAENPLLISGGSQLPITPAPGRSDTYPPTSIQRLLFFCCCCCFLFFFETGFLYVALAILDQAGLKLRDLLAPTSQMMELMTYKTTTRHFFLNDLILVEEWLNGYHGRWFTIRMHLQVSPKLREN